MKLLKKLLLAIGVTIVTLTAMPKIMPEWQNQVQAASVKISSTKKTMYKGYTYNLKITGTNQKVKWSSSDKSKAAVNSKGKVYAKKNGKVTITAKVAGKKYKCKVTVKNKPYYFTQFNTTFYDLKDVAKEYRDVEKVKNYKDFVFDLDGDGRRDNIRLKYTGLDENGEKAYVLQYNGNIFYDFITTWCERVYVADLNKNDKKLELVVKTAGPGDCFNYGIFSKIGSKIKLIKNISSAYISDEELKVDQKGKIIINDCIMECITPKVSLKYYQFNNNKIKTKKRDVNKIKNIKFKTKNEMLFSTSMKNLEILSYYEYEQGLNYNDALKKAGIIEGKFKSFNILGIDESGAVKVKLKNGTKGYLFTTAGFLAG